MNQIQLTSALLQHSKSIDLLSTLLLLATIAATLVSPFIFIISCLLLITGVLGLFLKYIALRLSFDREVFAWFSQVPAQDMDRHTEQMDNSLNQLQLISAGSKPNWDERCQGTNRLIRTQFILCCLQAILLLVYCSFINI